MNRLNVYPVPDGDTGTNMALTVESVVEALDDIDLETAGGDADGRGLPGDLERVAHGGPGQLRASSSARSSVASPARSAPAPVVGAHEAAVALEEGSAAARAGVMRPVEGTMLTVAADAATAAQRVDDNGGGDLLTVFEAARQAAVASLWRTPDLLPVLARAGVVDAGGAGLVLLYDAFLHVLDGRPIPETLPLPPEVVGQHRGAASGSASTAVRLAPGGLRLTAGIASSRRACATRSCTSSRRPTTRSVPFKEVWAGIGDSIVVVGGDGLWNCHIHTDDIGAAIEAALDAGRPRDIRVTDLLDQVEEESWVRRAEESGADSAAGRPRARRR